MVSRCVLLTGVTMVCAMGVVTRAHAEPTVLPDITISGSTTGDAKFAAAAAVWVPVGKSREWTPKLRPKWFTFAADLSGTLNNGETVLERDSDTGGLSSGSAWFLGVSLGVVHGHSANDLFGKKPLAEGPLGTPIGPAAEAAQFCSGVCTEYEGAPGCTRFKNYEKWIVKKAKRRWFVDNILTSQSEPGSSDAESPPEVSYPESPPGVSYPESPPEVSYPESQLGVSNFKPEPPPQDLKESRKEIADSMRKFVPATRGVSCAKATQGWEEAIKAYLQEKKRLAKYDLLLKLLSEFESSLGACAKECGLTSTKETTLSEKDCSRVKQTKKLFAGLDKPDYAGYEGDAQKHLCDVGGEQLRQAYKYKYNPLFKRLEAARYQRFQFSGGGSVGVSGQEFLEEVDSGTVQSYTPAADAYFLAKAGASSAGVFLNGFTVEGLLLWERTVVEGTTSAQWCNEEGVVVESDKLDAIATSCQTRPLGQPTTSNRNLAADFRVGYAHLKSGAFRFAGGPRYVLSDPADGTGLDHTIGFQLPIYANFLAVPRRNEKLDYDGFVRIAPFANFGIKRSSTGKVPYNAGVSFALLGRRSLFSTKYDEL